MDTLINGICIRQEHCDEMRSDVEDQLPNEACGLVAGKDRCSVRVFPIKNILASPIRFRLDPQQQLDAMLSMEEQGFDMMAIYHSHPAGPPHPSVTDIVESAYPDVVNLIWYPQGGEWRCRGFIITTDQMVEVTLDILGEK
ncbi:MAG: M67 family metallopeptidase [Anaerolineales bacterium]|jgi:proteasome lid subunit RPN8/RPN11